MMNIEFLHSEKGDGNYNEDIIGFHNNTYWIIDGSTSLSDNNYFSNQDVLWLVKLMNDKLSQYTYLSLEDMMYQSLEEIRHEAKLKNKDYLDIDKYKLPTFAISLFRVTDEGMDYYILADCSIIVSIDDEIKYITDDRITKFSVMNKEKIKSLSDDDDDIENKVKDVIIDTRKKMNTKDNYYVGSLDGVGLPYAIKGSLKGKVNKILSFSDGFLRAFNNKFEDEKNLNLNIVKGKLHDLRIEEKYIKERLNEESSKKVKKVSDDVSIILLENLTI